jgi:hypothetical protein
MSDQNRPPQDDDWGPRDPWRPPGDGPGAQQPGPQPGGPQPGGPQPGGPQPGYAAGGPQPGYPGGPQPGGGYPGGAQPGGPQPGGYQGGYPSYPGGQQAPGNWPDQPVARPTSNTAQTLAIIGIVCILICSPAAIVLGLLAQSRFREQGQPDTLAKIAWIGGIVSIVIGILIFATNGSS